ncbi:Pentatricopeptide repeat [Dillenia turbinata]|uniref:Pentatricopeptide repeat n=1 Tax=Dillenia turbinata TaxID=194707 RepID=A0AAN8WG93_9MAGN
MTWRHYVQLLESCIQSKSLTLGKQIHQAIIKDNTHFNNFTVLENLTHLYAKCDQILYARRVFDKISNPRVILWNIMIRAYAWNGPFEEAIDLYHLMLFSGIKPTKYTYPFVLKACSSLQAVEDGMDVHDHVKLHRLESDVYICTALVDFYAKCGNLVEARRVFDAMMDKDVVAWNAMIAGSSLHGLYDDTLRVVIQMQKAKISPNSSTLVAILPAVAQANALSKGKAIHSYCVRRGFDGDVVIETGLLDMYGKCRCQLYGQRIFNTMGFKNEVTWSAMIGACLSWGDPKGALELFHHMFLTGTVNASPVTFGSILRACAELTDLGKGRQIHCHVIKLGCFLDLMLGNTLISMYAKCGSVSDAIGFFDEMICKDTVSYSAVISGCVQNGNAEEALDIFHQMQLSGVEPDSATMVGILPACSHLAALQHGRCSHSYLIVHGLATEVSCCNALIDMYAKCGRIDVAREVFNRMAKRDIITWNALIADIALLDLLASLLVALVLTTLEIACLRFEQAQSCGSSLISKDHGSIRVA